MIDISVLESQLLDEYYRCERALDVHKRALEKDGIITRTVFPEVPPRVEYALSELGDSMRPIIQAMEAWGVNYQKMVQEAE